MSHRATFKLDGVKLEIYADTVAVDQNIGSSSTLLQFHRDGVFVAEMEYLWRSRNAQTIEETLAIFLNSKGEL